VTLHRRSSFSPLPSLGQLVLDDLLELGGFRLVGKIESDLVLMLKNIF
jgi:hypothetical protein